MTMLNLAKMPKRESRTEWGRWHFDPRLNVLQFRRSGSWFLYEIDLDRMTTSAQCLDWIFQVAFKTWMTAQDRSDLLEAIRDRVNPQANLCPWGIARGRRKRTA